MNQAFGGAIGGAAQGAAIGGSVGGPWGAAIGALGGGALGLLAGGIGDDMAAYNAQMAQYNAMVQAGAYRAAAEYNANAIMGAAQATAQLQAAAGNVNAQTAQNVANYNAAMTRLIANFNAGRLEDQAMRSIKNAELDAQLLDREIVKLMGTNRAYFANAGVQVNRQGDTPQRVAIDVRTQGDLDIAIIRHNAEQEAADLQNDAAATKFVGGLNALQQQWEGYAQASMMQAQNMMNTSAMMINAATQAATTKYQGALNAWSSMYGGQLTANAINYQNQQQGWANLYSGIMGAGQMGIVNYMASQTPNTGTRLSSASRPGLVLAQQGHPAWERTIPALNT
jgi:hypothetical protein